MNLPFGLRVPRLAIGIAGGMILLGLAARFLAGAGLPDLPKRRAPADDGTRAVAVLATPPAGGGWVLVRTATTGNRRIAGTEYAGEPGRLTAAFHGGSRCESTARVTWNELPGAVAPGAQVTLTTQGAAQQAGGACRREWGAAWRGVVRVSGSNDPIPISIHAVRPPPATGKATAANWEEPSVTVNVTFPGTEWVRGNTEFELVLTLSLDDTQVQFIHSYEWRR